MPSTEPTDPVVPATPATPPADHPHAAMAAAAGIPVSLIALLIQEFGPLLANVLIGLLSKQPATQAMMAAGDTPTPTPTPTPVVPAINVNVQAIIAALLTSAGPNILDAIATELEASNDSLSKVVATLIRSYGPALLQTLISWLSTPPALKAIAHAMAHA